MILEIKSLIKKFDNRLIINAFDLEVSKGDFISFIGPSGCGKTTLLNLIAGIDTDFSGNIIHSPANRLSFVFQSSILLPWMTLYDNVLLPNKLNNRPQNNVNEILQKVGLHEYKFYYPNMLSGGMQRRASIACALASSPNLLLFDEPFSGLDFINRQNLTDLFLGIFDSDQTVIMTTHFIEDAILLSKKIVLFPVNKSNKMKLIEVNLPHPREKNDAFYQIEKIIKDYYSCESVVITS